MHLSFSSFHHVFDGIGHLMVISESLGSAELITVPLHLICLLKDTLNVLLYTTGCSCLYVTENVNVRFVLPVKQEPNNFTFLLLVSNKWIHERGQEWRRPCGLNETEWRKKKKKDFQQIPSSSSFFFFLLRDQSSLQQITDDTWCPHASLPFLQTLSSSPPPARLWAERLFWFVLSPWPPSPSLWQICS